MKKRAKRQSLSTLRRPLTGAYIRVADADCDGDFCPGEVCGQKLVTPVADETYSFICDIVGSRV